MPVIYRNDFTGQIGYRLDFRTSYEKGNQMVRVVWRRRWGLFGIATQHSFRVTGTVGIIRFLFRRWYRLGGRRLLRDRRTGRHLLLHRSGIGIRSGTASGM
jgi:hypothetical protein